MARGRPLQWRIGKTDPMPASTSAVPATRWVPAIRWVVTALAVVVPTLGLAGPATAGPAHGPVMTPLVGTGSTLPTGAAVEGPADPASIVHAEVVLRPRDPAALDAFVLAVSTPGSPDYRHYLPKGRFGTAFGPADATLAATRAWLSSSGLEVGPTASDGLFVPVSGPAAEVERTFAVRLVEARLPSGTVARVGLGDPTVPAALAPAIRGVIGLSEKAALHPRIVLGGGPTGTGRLPATANPGGSATPVAHLGPSPCPAAASLRGQGAWTADQLASTYGLSTLYGEGRAGAGQSVGVFELESYQPGDIQTYESCYGIHVPVTDVTVDGGAGTTVESGEAALDIETVAGLAPSSSVIVYTGPQSPTGPMDTYRAMVDGDRAKVLSTSWGQCEPVIDPTDRATETTLFAQAAAQGQTVLAASGDSGSSDCYPETGSQTLAVDDPADQPDVTGVGGTSLTAASPNAPTETVWNGAEGAGGGGNSTVFVAPTWQQVPGAQIPGTTQFTCPPHGSGQCREVPDVAASADPDHGAVIFFGGEWLPAGGTSVAAPLWAAVVTATDQGCASPAGRLGPALYSSGAASSFNDVTLGNNSIFPGMTGGQFAARAGYDLATGWGSPKAALLLGLLSGSAAGCPAVTGLSPASGRASGAQTVVIGGSGFGSGTPTVRFGGTPAVVTAHTPTTVTVTTPDVVSGRQSVVTVTTTGPAAGTSAAVPAATFTFISPEVTSVVPTRGPTAGGGQVTISGSDFGGATAVRFGTTPSPSFRVTSNRSIVAVVPPGPARGATVDVSVTSPDGTSPAITADRYTFALPGYWLVATDGGIFDYGNAGFFGSSGNLVLNRPVVGMASTPDDRGYWLVASDGGIFAYGDAGFYGSSGNLVLNRPVVGMAATPDGRGYWLVASDGGIFAYGDAGFYGSSGNLVLNRPVVGMASTPDDRGYWLVASDGGIFAYGDAGFYGSSGNLVLNRPVVGTAATPDGRGYWLVASDGGIFAYGDAAFHGSTGNLVLNRPVVGMAPSLTGRGYWLVASDGGIFAFGDAAFYGSTGNLTLNRPVVGMAST